MQVSEHFVGAPAPDEFDDVGVHLAAKEGHGTSGSQCTSGDVAWKDAEFRVGCGSRA